MVLCTFTQLDFIIFSYAQYCIHNINFEGCEFCGFRCKHAKLEILTLERKQWITETVYSTIQLDNQQKIIAFHEIIIRLSKTTMYSYGTKNPQLQSLLCTVPIAV